MPHTYHAALTAAALVGLSVASTGQAASAQAYSVSSPINPNYSGASTPYTDADKAAQRQAYLSVVSAETNAVTGGNAASYTVPPGVYRITTSAPRFALNPGGFTLNVAGCHFIREDGYPFIDQQDNSLSAAGLSLIGDGKTTFDEDPVQFTQGTITSYDPGTGATTIRIMPGYPTAIKAADSFYSFKSDGTPLTVLSYERYSGGSVDGGGVMHVTLATAIDLQSRNVDPSIYQVGSLISTGGGGASLVNALGGIRDLTVQGINDYSAGSLAYGGGGGSWKFIDVKHVRAPGTNRLTCTNSCQISGMHDVDFDGCDLSVSGDDLVDVSVGGLAIAVRQEAPAQIVAFCYGYAPGDTLSFISSDGKFLPAGSGTVASATPIPSSEADYSALEAQAAAAISADGSATITSPPLYRIVFQNPVTVGSGEYVENRTIYNASPKSFTMRYCNLHDSGGRVLCEGFDHYDIGHNRFTNLHGGIVLGPDTYNRRGNGEDVNFDDNVLTGVTNSIGFPPNQAALVAGAGGGWSGPAGSAVVTEVNVKGNVFHGAVTGGILVGNATKVTVTGNVLDGIQGAAGYDDGVGNSPIRLNSVLTGVVSGNTVTGSSSPALWLTNCSGVAVSQNFTDSGTILISGSAGVTSSGNLRGDLLYNVLSMNNGQVADVLDASLAAGAAIVQNAPGSQTDRLWRLAPYAGSGTHRLMNRNSGLDIVPAGGGLGNGVGMAQAADSTASDHLWSLLPNADGASFRLWNGLSERVLALSTTATTPGTLLTQWDDNGTTDHNWRFVSSTGPVPVPAGLAASATNLAITLNWSPSSAATGYNVYRSVTAGGEGGTPVAANVAATTYTDATAVYGTTYYYKVAAVDADGTSGLSNEASSTLQATVAGYQINSGGGATGSFAADAFFDTGSTYSSGATVDTTGVSNPAPLGVYQTERYGSFTYTLPNLAASQAYVVRLHFAETYAGGPAQRQFSVSLNGSQVLTNFDIYAAAGGQNKAVVEQFTVPSSPGGQIVIALTNGAYGNPKINGIEVASSVAVNCGGGAAGAFAADAGYSGGSTYSSGATIDTSGVVSSAPQSVYQSERYGALSYTLGGLLPGKSYTVRLHFAELYFTGSNQRQFNVAINGAPVLTNFDVYAAAGAQNKAVVEQFTAAANGSGQIVVALTNGAYDNPKINGIEINP